MSGQANIGDVIKKDAIQGAVALLPGLATTFEKGLGDVLPLAKLYVRQLMGDTTADDEAKRKQAAASVKADAVELGKEVGDGIINLAVELAVQFVQQEVAQAVA